MLVTVMTGILVVDLARFKPISLTFPTNEAMQRMIQPLSYEAHFRKKALGYDASAAPTGGATG